MVKIVCGPLEPSEGSVMAVCEKNSFCPPSNGHDLQEKVKTVEGEGVALLTE